ncbi:hypothetical protein BH10PLA2_BH10PLA2_00110 [soil metagenome]
MRPQGQTEIDATYPFETACLAFATNSIRTCYKLDEVPVSYEPRNPLNKCPNELLKTLATNSAVLNLMGFNKLTQADVMRERDRRKERGNEPFGLAVNIVLGAKAFERKRITYTDLWHCYYDGPNAFRPSSPFNKPFDALARACDDLGLPQITSLVVRKDGDPYSDEAITNVFNFGIKNGLTRGLSPLEYIFIEARRAERLAYSDLVAAFQHGVPPRF